MILPWAVVALGAEPVGAPPVSERVLPVAVDRVAADPAVELRQGVGWLRVPSVELRGSGDLSVYAWTESLRVQVAPLPGRVALYANVGAGVVTGADPYSFYRRGFDLGYELESGARLAWLRAPRTGTTAAVRALVTFRRGTELRPSAFVRDLATDPAGVAGHLLRGPILDVLLDRSTALSAGGGLSVAQALGPCGLQVSAELTHGAARRTTWAEGEVVETDGPVSTFAAGAAFDVHPDGVPFAALVELYRSIERGPGRDASPTTAHDLHAALALVWVGPDDEVEIGLLGRSLLAMPRSAPGSLVGGEVRVGYTPGRKADGRSPEVR